MSSVSPLARGLRIGGAVVGWGALAIQLFVTISNCLEQHLGFFYALGVYFSFFTILTNLLVAIAQTSLWLKPESALARFFGEAWVQTGLVVNILLVCAVYELLLRNLWIPTGWQLVGDTLLHDIAPPLYFAYWFAGVPKGYLLWSDLLRWLVYPLVYVIITLLRGAVTHTYPYGFLDAHTLGYTKVTLTVLVLAAALSVMGAMLVAIDHGPMWSGDRGDGQG